MHDRILVPLDGSRLAEEVIPYAVALARATGAELALLRVAEDAGEEPAAHRYVERLAAEHGARALAITAPGSVSDVVLAEAGNTPATLVAMTSRGHSGVLEALLGSVAQDVVRGAGAPVLVYCPTGTDRVTAAPVTLRRVVLALDGTAPSEAMGDEAAAFARWLDLELEVVRVVGAAAAPALGVPAGSGELMALESGYVRTRAQRYARAFGVRVSWEVLRGEPVAALCAHVAQRRDTVLAMFTRRLAPVETAVLGSVTAGCLRRAGVPILMRVP